MGGVAEGTAAVHIGLAIMKSAHMVVVVLVGEVMTEITAITIGAGDLEAEVQD